MVENLTGPGGFLFGRRTYEASRALAESVRRRAGLAEPLRTRPKYVASMTLTAPLGWQNPRLLQGRDDDRGFLATYAPTGADRPPERGAQAELMPASFDSLTGG